VIQIAGLAILNYGVLEVSCTKHLSIPLFTRIELPFERILLFPMPKHGVSLYYFLYPDHVYSL